MEIDTSKDEISPPDWIAFDFKEKAYRCFLRYKYPELKVIIIDIIHSQKGKVLPDMNIRLISPKL